MATRNAFGLLTQESTLAAIRTLLEGTRAADVVDRATRVLGAVRLGTARQIAAGIEAQASPWGGLRTTPDWTTLFYDSFDHAQLDTVNRWSLTGTAPSISGGIVAFPMASNTTTLLQTKDNVAQVWSSAFAVGSFLVRLGTGTSTGVRRFWGIGTAQPSPSLNAMVQHGAGFETDPTTGELVAVTYISGTRNVVGTIPRPTDGAFHRYSIFYRGSRSYWYLDSTEVPVATAAPVPLVAQNQPVLVASMSGTVTGTPTFDLLGVGVGDTGRNNVQISDGTDPWRKARVDNAGALYVASAPRRSANATPPGTVTFPSSATPGIVIPANPNRVSVLIQNPNNADLVLGYGANPSLTTGLRVPSRGNFTESNYTGAIHGCSATTTALTCPYVEISL